MIRNFPAEIVNEQAIQRHFEELIEKNSTLKQNVQRVKEKRRRRRTLSQESNAATTYALSVGALERGDTPVSISLRYGETKPTPNQLENKEKNTYNREGSEDTRDLLDGDWQMQDQETRETPKEKEKSGDTEFERNEALKSVDVEAMTGHDRNSTQQPREETETNHENETEHSKKPIVIAVHVAWEVREVLDAIETYKDIEDQLEHYKQEKRLRGYRPLIWFPPLTSLIGKVVYLVLHFNKIIEGILYGGARGKLDAIRELKRKKGEQIKQVELAKERALKARGTGIVFVTFSCSAIAKVSMDSAQVTTI